jgi:hypothetical protein
MRKLKATNPPVNSVVASARMFQTGVNGYRQAIRCRRYHEDPANSNRTQPNDGRRQAGEWLMVGLAI